MSTELVQLFPVLRDLKRAEKLYVIQFLVSELAQAETELIQPGVTYPVWLPYDAFDAAATMLQALAKAKVSDHASAAMLHFHLFASHLHGPITSEHTSD